MSRQVVTAALLAGIIAIATPVAAQRQRNPGGGGGGAVGRGGGQGQGQGGRQSGAGPYRGGRAVSQDRGSRPQGGGGYQQPRQYAAPQQYAARPQASPRSSAAPAGTAGGYAVRRNPGYAGGYVNRGYSGRYVDQGYARPGYAAPVYGRPGYAAPHGYAVPRGYAAPYGYARGYAGHGYYGPPRYIAPGWHGGWGRGYVVVTPRYISPYVVGYSPWYPYYYRPSIGIGIYYGAYGYPFGAVAPGYYDPAPGAVLGGLRITDAPQDAQVFADGNYVGIVDDFDGVSQHLNLEPGQHRIEIHAPGLTPISFDVVVQAGSTITLRAEIY